ncbi:protein MITOFERRINLIKE 1, chloroplastic [Fagus crenata]
MIGVAGGGIAGAFTYVCLHQLDTIKTKLQTKGTSQIYANTFDDRCLHRNHRLHRIFCRVFRYCELGKSVLSKLDRIPSVLIPPTAGAMGNIVSSAIMVPKELITQRMQAGAQGRSWQVLLRILERDGVLGLYAGYSATLLRNLLVGVLNYSSLLSLI